MSPFISIRDRSVKIVNVNNNGSAIFKFVACVLQKSDSLMISVESNVTLNIMVKCMYMCFSCRYIKGLCFGLEAHSLS